MPIALHNIEKRKKIETFEYLDRRLSYNHLTGDLHWKVLFPGKKAGTRAENNCIKLSLERLDFKAHRVCWILHYQKLPKEGYVIDHINGNFLDNRIYNLRECLQCENSKNVKKPKNNTTGAKGVSYNGNNFRAYICVNRKQIHLGTFKTIGEASSIYRIAAIKYFGEYACLTR